MASSSLVFASVVLLLLTTLVAAQPAGWFNGDGTQYTLSHPSNGNCNFMSFPEEATTKYAALNKPQFKSTTNCGRCAQVTCVDAKCAGSTASEIVHIVDQCPECVRGDLDLSPEVFKSITGHQSDRVKIQWKFVDCPVRGPIQYCLKEGSSQFWTAIQPTNFLVGIKSLRVNGQDTTMVDSAYYFLRDGKSATQTDLGSLQISITSVSGEVLEETISLAGGGCVKSKYQFSKDRSADSESDFSDATAKQDAGPATASTQAPTSAPTPSPTETTPAPTTATPTPTWTTGSSALDTGASRLRGSNEAGVVTPPSDEPVEVGTPDAGVVREITTRSGNLNSTSPVLLILLVLACTCILVLVILAIVVKHKRRLKREAAAAKHDVEHVSELPPLVVQERSYAELESPSSQADIAHL